MTDELEQDQEQFDLTVELGGERLDRWLAQHLVQFSRGRLQELIGLELVSRNGKPCRSKDLVHTGDHITVTIPALTPSELIPQAMNLAIVYEDEALIVVNKAVGMVVHPSAGHTEATLVHGLLAHCGQLSGINGVERPGIVHRLDRDTTGLLVVAKNDQAHRHLQLQIQQKSAQREYLGVVHGAPKGESGMIEGAIGRHPQSRQKMAVVPDGREARTHWQLLERLGNFSVLHFRLETGRTHQIRVHSRYIGHPIVGDPVYSHGKAPIKLPGQALHAWRLSFVHPVTEEVVSFEAPPPGIFMKLLRQIGSRLDLTSLGNG